MYMKWGSAYQFADNSVDVAKTIEFERDEADRPYCYKAALNVTGKLFASGQAACTLAESALHTALTTQYRDLIFYHDDNTPSAIGLTNADSLTGVVIDNISFSGTHGAEYATLRTFSFRAWAEYAMPRTSRNLISYRETFTYTGGGPLYAVREAINGVLPIRELIYPYTAYILTQSGEAVGFQSYPAAPQPAFPSMLRGGRDGNRVTRDAPRRRGVHYQNYPITWEYVFESPTPLSALPKPWPLNL